jgi:hypothetical protein
MFGNICSARRTLDAAKVFAQHPSLSQLLFFGQSLLFFGQPTVLAF